MIKHKIILTSQARLANHPTLSAIYSVARFTPNNASYKHHLNKSIPFINSACLMLNTSPRVAVPQ